MLTVVTKGDWKDTETYLKKLKQQTFYDGLDGLARQGVQALASATPVDSGLSSESWGYEIEIKNGACSIRWLNHDIENGFPVAIMIQYGHGTGTGGYVQGVNYINPAIKPVFDQIADKVWKAVTS